jgi:hypothetical protein
VPGTIRFFEIPDSGLSTGDPQIADRHRTQGFEVRQCMVPCLTIDQALAPYADRELHWMKIDVEGLEGEVIAGWDGARIRPWVLVVESTAPLSGGAAHHGWEPLLLGKGYQFAYFDGLNRFYVSKDHPELVASFAAPPNYFDDFVLSGTSGAFTNLVREQLGACEGELDRTRTQLDACVADRDLAQQTLTVREAELVLARQTLAAREAELDRTGQQLDACAAELDLARQTLATRETELDRFRQQLDACAAELDLTQHTLAARTAEFGHAQQTLLARRAELDLVYASQSWRLTQPLRSANCVRGALATALGQRQRQAVALARGARRDLPRHAVLWVSNRPRLAGLARRLLARFPALRRRLRQHFARGPSLAQSAAAFPAYYAPVAALSQESDLSDSAVRVLRDLQRAMPR